MRIIDFGIALVSDSEISRIEGIAGSPSYMSPEQVHGGTIDARSDIFSFGVLLYEMLAGVPPFQNKDRHKLYQTICTTAPQMRNHFSKEACSLLQSLLTVKPQKRLGANGVSEIKSHPFFKGIEWEPLARQQVDPPFKPNLKSQKDLKYFDAMFLKETVKDTLLDKKDIPATQGHFQDFTYDHHVLGNKKNKAPNSDIEESSSDSDSASKDRD